ncbi:MAG: hypothetical protein JWP80_875 [Pseudomonas sp.]|nr:hypothetical protein [Pseudomonas sp.]
MNSRAAGRNAVIFNAITERMSCAYFLTQEDRQLIAEMYEYVQGQRADLAYVDDYAFTLGYYRQGDNGQLVGPQNRGYHFDREGHMVSVSFTDKDAAAANRILEGEGIQTTRLDQKYLRHKLNKDYGAMNHSDFDFLEQMVNTFSAKGDEVTPLGTKFARKEYINNNYVQHLSKEVYQSGPNGPVRKGTVAATDPNAALNNKKNSLNTKPINPETVQDMFRRIMAKAWGSGWGLPIRSLAEFLMNSGR